MKPKLEEVGLGIQHSILAFRYAKHNFDAPWHFHPQHELTYIEDSVGTKFIGDYVGAYQPGELVLLRSNLPHYWKNHTDQKEQAVSTVIQWNKEIIAEVPELKNIFALLKAASRGLIFDRQETSHLIPLVKKMPEQKAEKLYITLLEILAGLSECAYKTLSESTFKNNLSDEYTSRMSKIHNFIEDNYQRKIYLKEIGTLLNMSEQSFSRFFSKTMGRPFFTFLNEYRINMASRMLIDTDWSIAEIGFASGYESLPFFHKQFNKYKDISPASYRKKYKL